MSTTTRPSPASRRSRRPPAFRLRRIVESYDEGFYVVDVLSCGHEWRFNADRYRSAMQRRCHGCTRQP
jgi:hypothetical protein